MAIAIRMEEMVRKGEVADYADLARIGHVTRARMTQIMNMLHLAPDIQEEILFLPREENGCSPVTLRKLMPIVAVVDWRRQRGVWREVTARLLRTFSL